ncbi:MAG: hypothetical protein O3A46_09185, partial [Candidatus Poribacteria bacterium]|nr:hypothetical protein [Candidatus Poribacteria bacterium]
RGGQTAFTVEKLLWTKNDNTYLCLVENPVRGAQIDGMGMVDQISDAAAETLELRFAQPVKELWNERTYESYGSGTTFKVTWNPHEAAFLRVDWDDES